MEWHGGGGGEQDREAQIQRQREDAEAERRRQVRAQELQHIEVSRTQVRNNWSVLQP
jgi:hypothetical protein